MLSTGVSTDDKPNQMACSLMSPAEALRSEPGLMRGEPAAVLKAAAYDILLGYKNYGETALVSLALLRSAISGLEANEVSRLALEIVLRGVQVRGLLEVSICVGPDRIPGGHAKGRNPKCLTVIEDMTHISSA